LFADKYESNYSDNSIEHIKNEDFVHPAKPLHLVHQIQLEIAQPFIERWHYSEKVPTGKNVFFGWYIEDILYAVADYGIGVNYNIYQYLMKITGKAVTPSNLYELKRLCRTDPQRPQYPLTQFLAVCHKMLKREHGIRFVASYSDPEYNQFLIQKGVPYDSGGLYKAANFEYLGKTNAEHHVIDENRRKHHRKYAYHYMRRQNAKGNPITLDEARKVLGVKTISTEPKDRWFLDLGEQRLRSKRPEGQSSRTLIAKV
jgi:hypothetical protein